MAKQPLSIPRFLCVSFILIFTGLSIYTFDDTYEKTNCSVEEIKYPDSFNDYYFWRNCTCTTDFCIPICYCIEMYVGGNLLLNKKSNNTNCTLVSNIIPFDLNFENIIDTYLNKTITCWVKDGEYYINIGSVNNFIYGLTCIRLILVVFFIIMECGNSQYYTNSVDYEQEDFSEIPPPYEISPVYEANSV